METYEKIYKIIELYNKYKGNLNDDGTIATDEQIAEWIVPSIEEEINEIKLNDLAEEYDSKVPHFIDSDTGYTINYRVKEAFKAGYRKAKSKLCG